jgi:Icc protein
MPQGHVTFVHISDTHIHNDPSYDGAGLGVKTQASARALVRAINGLPFKPDFILHTGDVAYDPHEEAYHACAEILGQLTSPVFYVAGNHDASAALQKTFIRNRDIQLQLHYSTEVNGVQLVVVDSNGVVDPPAGHITDMQLTWLKKVCQADDPRPLIIATHHNPTRTGIDWLDNYMGIQNSAEFHEAILPAKHRLRGVFFGHVHQNIDLYRDGILYASTASSWVQLLSYPGQTKTEWELNADAGYSIVSITPEQTFIRRCRFRVDGGE